MERLDKILSESGICTRREARDLVRKKRIRVNGKEASSFNMKVSEEDTILLD